MLFLEYPTCSTCKKAKKWLDEHGVSYEDRHIRDQNPTVSELKEWQQKSGMELKKFFNTSGMKYRELGLKDRLPQMSDEEKLELLASDGMLVKRPLVIGDDFALTGFNEVVTGNMSSPKASAIPAVVQLTPTPSLLTNEPNIPSATPVNLVGFP